MRGNHNRRAMSDRKQSKGMFWTVDGFCFQQIYIGQIQSSLYVDVNYLAT